jgi:hypothetical protein
LIYTEVRTILFSIAFFTEPPVLVGRGFTPNPPHLKNIQGVNPELWLYPCRARKLMKNITASLLALLLAKTGNAKVSFEKGST